MAENKGGSDLDVFEGLAKKKPSPSGAAPGAPSLPGAVPSQRGPVPPPPSRQKTLLGMAMPNVPPPAPSQRSSALPPPAPPARPSSLPPAPAARPSLAAPPPPPSRSAPPASTAAPSPLPPVAPPVSQAAPLPPPAPVAAPDLPAPTPSTLAAPVDMDWDDEDEKTTIFDKGDAMQSLAAPLPAAGAPAAPAPAPAAPLPAAGMPPASRTLISTGPASALPAPAPRPASVPPPAPRSAPPPASVMPASLPRTEIAAPPPSYAMPAPSGGSKTGLVIGLAVAGAVLLGAGVFALAQPKDGKIAVFVAASGGRSLDDVSVFVDGQQCQAPCRLELPKGVHEVKATAPGYAPVTQGVTVIAGQEQAVNIRLDPASAGTGFRVAGNSNVTLFVDGKEVGALPQEIKDLSPGSHTLRFKGGDLYAEEERTINVAADQIQDLGTVQLKIARGLASFDIRTPGAMLTLVSGSDRRPLLDATKPVELDATKGWALEATKAGYEDFRAPLSFDDKAEKTFVVELAEKAKAVAPVAAVQPARPVERPQPKPEAAPKPAQTKPAPAAAGGTCTLNINSIPVSNVVLDGRPLGGTPKLGVSASAGSHTVVFVHPEYGKKSTQTTCKAGETKTVAMRLNN